MTGQAETSPGRSSKRQAFFVSQRPSFTPCSLRIVAHRAHRLPVLAVPEQVFVSTVRDNVVDHGRWPATPDTDGMLAQISIARTPPDHGIPPLVGCSTPVIRLLAPRCQGLLGLLRPPRDMRLTVPGLIRGQARASRFPARSIRARRHLTHPSSERTSRQGRQRLPMRRRWPL